MRYIDLSIIKTTDSDVTAWLDDAKLHLGELSKLTTHDERRRYMIKHNIWSEFKPILIRYYGEKCWYSECSLEGSFGDVDHFRPKNKATDDTGNVILSDGYWWLAYDFLNYRLSCEKSNRSFEHGGKNDMFPLKPGTIPATQGNKNDIPVLLDPCVDSDVALIDCNETGEIVALSSEPYEILRVEISKRIYNWDCFNGARKKVRSECKTALELFEILYEASPDRLESSISRIRELVDSQTPYSSFAKRYIELKIQDKPYKDVILRML